MKKFLTSKICRLTSWTVVLAMFATILPLQALADPYTPQQKAVRERMRFAREKVLEAEKISKAKPTKQPDIQPLTPVMMQTIKGRGAYRNKYLVGTMPWQKSFKDVNLCTGNLSKNFTDIQVAPAKGAGLVLSRTYNSMDNNIGPFGRGWQHAYDIRMEEAGNDNVDRTDFFGGKHVYKRDADGLYTPPPYTHDWMVSDYKSVLALGPSDVNSDLQTGQDGTKKHFILMGTVRYCDYIEDRFGNRTNLVYDANSLLSTVTDPSGRVLTFTWTNYGTQANPIYRITEVEGPLQTVTYEYYTSSSDPDAGGEAYNLKAVHIDPNGLNRITTFKYTSFTGTAGTENALLSSIVDPIGNWIGYTYGLTTYCPTNSAWVRSVNEPGGVTSGGVQRRNIYQIDTNSYYLQLLNTKIQYYGSIGFTLNVVVDSSLRAKYVMWDILPDISIEYDSSNNVTKKIAGAGDHFYSTHFGNYEDDYTYGPHGHMLTHTRVGLSGTDTYTYFDETKYFQKASVTDMAGNTTTYEVGATNDVNSGNRGNVLWVRDARYSQTGRQFSYAYDQYGRKTSETNLNNTITTFAYNDQWGNMTDTVQDPGGLARTTSMVYDAAGQPEEVSMPAPYAETISYTYGGNGRTSTVTDGRGTTSMTYEAGCDRAASVTDPVTGTVSYTYVDSGQKLTASLPSGVVMSYLTSWTANSSCVSYNPDDINQPISKLDYTVLSYPGGSEFRQKITHDKYGKEYSTESDEVYDSQGQRVGYISTRMYDDVLQSGVLGEYTTTGRIIKRETKWNYKVNGTWYSKIIAQNDYTYDAIGNRLTNTITLRDQTDAVTTRTETYGYDELYRLTSVNYGDGQTQGYSFDPMGNRIQKTDSLNPTENSTYNNANMLLTRNQNNYTNDANGNQLTGGGRENTWDSQNRLRQCVAGGVTTTYTYGCDGLRRSQTRNGVTTKFILDGDTVAQEWVDADSDGIIDPNETVTYFAGSFRRNDNTGETRWYVKDGLGSVLAEAGDPDANNNPIKSTRKMDVYGLFRASSGTPTSNHRFVGSLGHTYDDSTSLIYMRARYMDPGTGTFISEDPAYNGSNWFAYCNGNPVNLVDQNGKEVISPRQIRIGLLFAIFAALGYATSAWDMHTFSPLLTHIVKLVGYIDATMAAVETLLLVIESDKRSPSAWALAGAMTMLSGLGILFAMHEGMIVVALLIGQECDDYHLPGE